MFGRISRLAGCGEASCMTPAVRDCAETRPAGGPASRGMPAAPEGLPARPADDGWRRGTPTALAVQGWAGRAPARGTELADSDTALKAYMAARTIVGRPLDAAEAERLRQAHRSVDATRRALIGGRGNVSVDIANTLGASSTRSRAGRMAGSYLDRRHATTEGAGHGYARQQNKPDTVVSVATAALAAGAGHCAEHAVIAALVHAPHLAPQEALRIVQHAHADHMWTELYAPDGSGSVIVLDAWKGGTAVFHEDARLAADRDQVRPMRTLRRDDGMAAGDTVSRWVLDPVLGERIARNERRLGPGFRYPDNKVYPPLPVVSRAFAENVRERMDAPVDERAYAGMAHAPGLPERMLRRGLLNEVAAVGAARRTGSGVARAAGEAQDVLSAVRRLDL